jgi:hypothetical protein
MKNVIPTGIPSRSEGMEWRNLLLLLLSVLVLPLPLPLLAIPYSLFPIA